MKFKIQLIRLAVENWKMFAFLSIAMSIISVYKKLPCNNFPIICMFGIMVTILSSRLLIHMSDYVYNTAARRQLSDSEHNINRTKTVAICSCLGSAFILFFSSLSVGHPLTNLGQGTNIQGQPVSTFRLINRIFE